MANLKRYLRVCINLHINLTSKNKLNLVLFSFDEDVALDLLYYCMFHTISLRYTHSFNILSKLCRYL